MSDKSNSSKDPSDTPTKSIGSSSTTTEDNIQSFLQKKNSVTSSKSETSSVTSDSETSSVTPDSETSSVTPDSETSSVTSDSETSSVTSDSETSSGTSNSDDDEQEFSKQIDTLSALLEAAKRNPTGPVELDEDITKQLFSGYNDKDKDQKENYIKNRAAMAAYLHQIKCAEGMQTEARFSEEEYKELINNISDKNNKNDRWEFTHTDGAFTAQIEFNNSNKKEKENDSNGQNFDATIVEKTGLLRFDQPIATIRRIHNPGEEDDGKVHLTFVKQGKDKKDKEQPPSIQAITACVDALAAINLKSPARKDSITIRNNVTDAQIEGSLIAMALEIKRYGLKPEMDAATKQAVEKYDLKKGTDIMTKITEIQEMDSKKVQKMYITSLGENNGNHEKAIKDIVANMKNNKPTPSGPTGMSL